MVLQSVCGWFAALMTCRHAGLPDGMIPIGGCNYVNNAQCCSGSCTYLYGGQCRTKT